MLTDEDLYELVESFFREEPDRRLKIQCLGFSMTPFIRNKNIVTLKPVSDRQDLKTGDIVAVVVHGKKQILIHRIIASYRTNYLIKGDNNKFSDGWFNKDDVLGVVERIENSAGAGYRPKHWQNMFIAIGSRANVLKHAFLPGLNFLKT